MKERKSGILLHISCLPSEFGIGDLGPWAYQFIDFLSETKQHLWQILPLSPTDPICGNSPYSSSSAFAANTLLISPRLLAEDGLLTSDDLNARPAFSDACVDYEAVIVYKKKLFDQAYGCFKTRKIFAEEFETFCSENAFWLDDYAFFEVIKESLHGRIWADWPPELRDRKKEALADIGRRFGDQLTKIKFLQFVFSRQWRQLRAYARQKRIQLIGDIPIYVNHDSVDVWKQPEIFKLNEEGKPLMVAGVPPDYFSPTGQRWGNPVYDWENLKTGRYAWWIRRIKHNLTLYDVLRIDHFRGFVQYWEIPGHEPLATKGQWSSVPTQDFFATLRESLGYLPFIAEDLGIITEDVRELMNEEGFPGMKILVFAFNGDLKDHPYLPHNYKTGCVVYTGTHDNNTVQGWFQKEASVKEKENFAQYCGGSVKPSEVHWKFIELAMMSKANMVVFPMQDVLGLAEQARLNVPATVSGNWRWRMVPMLINHCVIQKLTHLTEISRRG